MKLDCNKINLLLEGRCVVTFTEGQPVKLVRQLDEYESIVPIGTIGHYIGPKTDSLYGYTHQAQFYIDRQNWTGEFIDDFLDGELEAVE